MFQLGHYLNNIRWSENALGRKRKQLSKDKYLAVFQLTTDKDVVLNYRDIRLVDS